MGDSCIMSLHGYARMESHERASISLNSGFMLNYPPDVSLDPFEEIGIMMLHEMRVRLQLLRGTRHEKETLPSPLPVYLFVL